MRVLDSLFGIAASSTLMVEFSLKNISSSLKAECSGEWERKIPNIQNIFKINPRVERADEEKQQMFSVAVFFSSILAGSFPNIFMAKGVQCLGATKGKIFGVSWENVTK